MSRYHDVVCARFATALRQEGERIAEEVGIPGGRVDVVRLDREGRWLEIYEVKVRALEDGVPQLQRYADAIVHSAPALTLVVPPGTASPDLITYAKAAGVRVHEFACVQLSLLDTPDYTWVFLPAIHPLSIARAAQRRAEWDRRFARATAA